MGDASRDTNAVDVDIEWRYARACLDASNALPEKDAKREGLTFEGLRAAERAAALAPDDGLAQKWLGDARECGRFPNYQGKNPELVQSAGGARRGLRTAARRRDGRLGPRPVVPEGRRRVLRGTGPSS